MRILQVLFWTAMSLTAPAQNSGSPDFRRPTFPTEGLERVQAFIQQYRNSRTSGNKPVSQGAYDSLSLREKFTYAMIHPERYLQNCAMFIYFFQRGKLFPRLSFGYNENTFSFRQIQFLKMNRDSVMTFLNEIIQQKKSWGINIKQAIIEINGWEFIPAMMTYYRQRPDDTDVLTTFMVLMVHDVFSSFVQSGYYRQLYGAPDSYGVTIALDKTTETFILNTAMDYYKSRTEKRSLKKMAK
ncbi:hypothetical protein LL912_15685 [Niabella sp. CC-SYL272]|uniref:hypothetical protein n=1 Tax=Niabella agricola TaxID=2891571 RepID=UPI001F2D4E8F|nr:hypothetical protein [Niabella agricola]MCF3110225.1 hypothetical protein [Niabella agricola]